MINHELRHGSVGRLRAQHCNDISGSNYLSLSSKPPANSPAGWKGIRTIFSFYDQFLL
jgi:hypothetical protein